LAHSMASDSRIVPPFALTMINNLGSPPSSLLT
jgi:hypothetical protein